MFLHIHRNQLAAVAKHKRPSSIHSKALRRMFNMKMYDIVVWHGPHLYARLAPQPRSDTRQGKKKQQLFHSLVKNKMRPANI